MTRHLLDVNVLLALVWPRHSSHSAAHVWFSKSGHQAWATNPLVQLGVLRLLTNPAVTLGAVSAATAMAVLREALQHPGHQFWPLDQDLAPALEDFTRHITGHQQWNDAVLLLQASAHDATLVSFDAGLKRLAKDSQTGRVLLLQER